MTENTKPKTTLETLQDLRQEFVQAAAANAKALAAVDQQISVAQRAEAETQRVAALAQLTGGNDNALKGHDVVFFINNTKDGAEGVLPKAVQAAHAVNNRVKTSGVKDATVVAKFFGDAGALDLNSRFGAKGYNTSGSNKKDVLPVANQILAANTPDGTPKTKNEKNYVVVGDGNVTGDLEAAAAILTAAATFNPKATFDFVVVNANDTATSALVEKLKENGLKANLVQVANANEVTGVVLKTLNARLNGTVHTQPAPVKPNAAVMLYKAPTP